MTNMEELTDEFERPLQFRPSWPPRVEEKPMPGYKPGFSLAFRKPNWPPPTDENVTTDSATGESSGPSSNNASESSQGPAPGAASPQNSSASAGGRPGQKPKRPERDYSAFFGKNALPHYEIKFVVKPDKVHLPEVFLGDSEESEEN